MGLRINQNIAAMNAYRNLSVTDNQMSKSLEKLSSGFRINRAADDAAGLSISEGLRSQIGGLKVAVRNSQDAINVVQTADGALTETHAILQRMRDLAVQASNDGSQDQNAKNAADTEFKQLQKELDRIANTTEFGSQKILDGSYSGTFQVGARNSANDRIQVDLSTAGLTTATGYTASATVAATAASWETSTAPTLTGMGGQTITVSDGTNTAAVTLGATDPATVDDIVTALSADSTFSSSFTASNDAGNLKIVSNTAGAGTLSVSGAGLSGTATAGTAAGTTAQTGINGFTAAGLGLGTSVDLTSMTDAQSAMDVIDNAIKGVSTARANLGAYQNRFEHTINNLNVAVQNLSASESQIRDTDMASEMTNFTRAQILSQAGTAMLAQANQAPQGVLQLLRG